MNDELLQKYIAGNATDAEMRRITEWIQASPDNMREYMAQRKLYDVALWHGEEARKKKRFFSFVQMTHEALKIAAVFAFALIGTYYWQKFQPAEDVLQTIHVPAGQRAELVLSDGTKVWLNSRSTLTFPGEFNGDMRSVKLDGEGYFAVARNTEHPFMVETDKYNVKALGTEFNVIAYSTEETWKTALLEGCVEILPPHYTNGGIRLEPNTMLSLQDGKLLKRGITEPDYFLWREGLLCFNNISVGEMMKKLELYYGVKIVVNNTQIVKNHYTGKFRSKDGVEHVLKVLKLSNRFNYTKDDESNIITIN